MAKLTNYSRDAIASRAIEAFFGPKMQELKDQEDALGREAYALTFPAAELALVAAVPDNWFRLDSCLRFNVGGQTIVLHLKGEGLPVPYRIKGEEYGGYNCHQIGVIEHGELCDRIQTLAQKIETAKADRRSAQRATKNMLNAVTTTGKLRDVWPEGAPFYAEYDDKVPANLPTVRVDEVNAMLGLAK